MVTIEAGKIACEIYNREHHTNKTPKELFCEVFAPVAFNDKRHLKHFNNDPFDQKMTKRKPVDYHTAFSEALEEECQNIETPVKGEPMTCLCVFCGCAKENESTTDFCKCDNLYFTVDERYCSFIGAFLCCGSNGFSYICNNREYIKDMLDSFFAYREFLNLNESLRDAQMDTWNSNYLYRKKVDQDFVFKIGKDGLETIPFDWQLYALSKYENIKYLIPFKSGKTNAGCSPILLGELPNVARTYDFFKEKKIYNDEKDIHTTPVYKDLFGGSDIFYRALENGAVFEDMVNPKKTMLELLNAPEKKVLTNYEKYLGIVMDKEFIEMAKKLAETLYAKKKATGKSHKEDFKNITTSPNLGTFLERLDKFIEETDNDRKSFKEIVDYIMVNDKELKVFLQYAKFNLNK